MIGSWAASGVGRVGRWAAHLRASTLAGLPGPSLVHRMERSILDAPDLERYPPFKVGGRLRRATCSGVAWLGADRLAVVNFYGRHLRIYDVTVDGLRLVHERAEGFAQPEDVSASSDGRWLAVSQTDSKQHGVSLHPVGADGAPGAAVAMFGAGRAPHGVALSPDGSTLGFTEIARKGALTFVDLPTGREVRTPSSSPGRFPKAVAFSRDGTLVAVGHSAQIYRHRQMWRGTRVAVHRWSARLGTVEPEPIAVIGGVRSGIANLESCAFLTLGGGLVVAVTDQSVGCVHLLALDPKRGQLRPVGVVRGFSFPHGVDVSPTGWMAVTTYGDDCVSLVPPLRAPPRTS